MKYWKLMDMRMARSFPFFSILNFFNLMLLFATNIPLASPTIVLQEKNM